MTDNAGEGWAVDEKDFLQSADKQEKMPVFFNAVQKFIQSKNLSKKTNNEIKGQDQKSNES